MYTFIEILNALFDKPRDGFVHNFYKFWTFKELFNLWKVIFWILRIIGNYNQKLINGMFYAMFEHKRVYKNSRVK